jgi:hypothetical protein
MPRVADRLLLFPTAGALSADKTHWALPVHAWVFRPEEDSRRRALLIRLLSRGAGVRADGDEAALLARRMKPFLVDNLPRQRPRVELAGHSLQLPPTDAGGHSQGVLSLPGDLPIGRHLLRGCLSEQDPDPVEVSVELIDGAGLSIVSDIDDTIKHSEVLDTSRLLRNTFSRPFESIPHMASLYRDWQSRGASFHYVSSSPWQLISPLQEMMNRSGFPLGSMHLKRFRLKDRSILSLLKDPRSTKPPIIQRLLDTWPLRRFILIGDSGEADPEVYGQISRDNPGRIASIYIRELRGYGRGEPRYRSAFAGIDTERWQLFTEPTSLPWPT